jgi:outer membrane murein-binding lipoprotein Lpp
MGSVRIIGIRRRGLIRPPKLIGSLRLLFALVLATLAVTGCGDEGDGAQPTAADKPVPRLTVQVSVLESDIAEYCETRNSGSASSADDDKAADDVRELIRLARRDPNARLGSGARPTVRDALAEAYIVLSSDCRESPLQRRVDHALKALR